MGDVAASGAAFLGDGGVLVLGAESGFEELSALAAVVFLACVLDGEAAALLADVLALDAARLAGAVLDLGTVADAGFAPACFVPEALGSAGFSGVTSLALRSIVEGFFDLGLVLRVRELVVLGPEAI